MTMPCDRKATDNPLAWLLSLRWLGRFRLRDHAGQRLCAVAGNASGQGGDVRPKGPDAARCGDAGSAQGLAARPRTLRTPVVDSRGRTVLTAATPADIREGDTFTIAGIHKPDRRWWPRFRNWLLRRPPPTLPELRQFKVHAVCGSASVKTLHIGQ